MLIYMASLDNNWQNLVKKNTIASHIIVFILLQNGTKLSACHILDRRENYSNYDLEQHRKIAMFQNQKKSHPTAQQN